MRLVCLFLILAGVLSAAPKLKDAYAQVNGVRLHYVRAGKGPLIVFLHGFPEFWYEWKAQLAEFGKDHLAVAPDMRGYNLSEKPASLDQYQMPVLIEDVRALAAHLGYQKFTLVGHDWGGAVAWAFAAAHPECLEKLVIVNAPHPAVFARLLREDTAQQKASQYMLLFRSPQAEAALTANHNAMLAQIVLGPGLRDGYFSDADRQAYLAAWSQPGAITGGLNYYRAMRVGPPAPGAAADTAVGDFACGQYLVKTPTLVIWGEKDQALTVGNLDGLEEFVPGVEIRRMPDATHWVIHEKPAEVNAAIREFLAK